MPSPRGLGSVRHRIEASRAAGRAKKAAFDGIELHSDIVSVQELFGHSWVSTTQRYCTVSNLKVMRDYFRAMEVIMQRTGDP